MRLLNGLRYLVLIDELQQEKEAKPEKEATPEKAKEDKTEAEKEVGDSHYVDIQLCSIFLMSRGYSS